MNTSTALNGIAPITQLGVLLVTGADARAFLQSQLTNDFSLQTSAQARLAAFLSAKGRMQASFIGVRLGQTDVLLVTDKSVLPAVQKRLSMFVLRAKARIVDVSDQWQICGLAGSAVAEHASQTRQPWDVQTTGQEDNASFAIRLYPARLAEGVDIARALWLGPAGAPAPQGTALSEAQWQWGQVHGGIASISAAVAEAFVPQMLNYESVDGVSFKKGCYPGQEVVARSQFRGAIKRRAYLAHGALPAGDAAAVQPGDEIYLASEPPEDAQPCGLVALAADAAEGVFAAIVSITISHADQALEIRRAGQAPIALRISPVPYPIREDI